MHKKILLGPGLLLLFGVSRAQVAETVLRGFQTLASEYPNIIIAIALAAIVFSVSKKVNPFNTHYKKDTKIPIALAIAVFLFTMVAVPEMYLPGFRFSAQGNFPGIVASLVFVAIVLWLLKEKKIESSEWVSFSLMLVSGALAFVLSFFNLQLLSSLASLSMFIFIGIFLFHLAKAVK